jgi:hypothetical protein
MMYGIGKSDPLDGGGPWGNDQIEPFVTENQVVRQKALEDVNEY